MGRFGKQVGSQKPRVKRPTSPIGNNSGAVVPGAKYEPIKRGSSGEEFVKRTRTALGALGYARDAKSELFLLGVSFMGGDNILHEKSADRYARLIKLVNTREVYEDSEWVWNFVNYLRNTAQMRTVSMVIAVEVVVARLKNNIYGVRMPGGGSYRWSNREIVSVACSRADEPAELLSYWNTRYGFSKWDRKLIPQPILAGIGDAAIRLWNEFSVMKYGGASNGATMKDVLRLARPKPKDDTQATLFAWIVGNVANVDEFRLPMIYARRKMQSVPRDERIHWLLGDWNANAAL
jgi:hypothetical protein